MNEENCQKCQIPDLRQLRQRLLGRGEAFKRSLEALSEFNKFFKRPFNQIDTTQGNDDFASGSNKERFPIFFLHMTVLVSLR